MRHDDNGAMRRNGHTLDFFIGLSLLWSTRGAVEADHADTRRGNDGRASRQLFAPEVCWAARLCVGC